jgi:hypothetical protein
MRPHCAWVEFHDQSKRAEFQISLWWRKSYAHNSGFSSFLHADLNKKQRAKGRAGYTHVKAYHMESSPFGFWIQHMHKNAPHWVRTHHGAPSPKVSASALLSASSQAHTHIFCEWKKEKKGWTQYIRYICIKREPIPKSIFSEPFWRSWGNVVFNFWALLLVSRNFHT